jgi:hypothetical protein
VRRGGEWRGEKIDRRGISLLFMNRKSLQKYEHLGKLILCCVMSVGDCCFVVHYRSCTAHEKNYLLGWVEKLAREPVCAHISFVRRHPITPNKQTN